MIRPVTQAVAALVAIALCSASPAGARTFTSPLVEGPFGNGADAAWVLRPRGPIRTVVVFAHGWKSHPSGKPDEWVEQFRPWLDHLLAGGSAVIFPRYQLGLGDSAGIERLTSFRRGLQTGFARLGHPPVPVIAAGYSFGGSLALHYAANARQWGLPVPAAVDSLFPSRPVPGAPLPRLPPRIHVLIQVGDRDTEAGSGGANSFQARLGGLPPSRLHLELIHSTSTLTASHAAPKLDTRGARAAFWAPLDRLIATARRERSSTPAAGSVSRIGAGADQVWILRPRGRAVGIVVFGHGWSTPLPAGFAPWLSHLRERSQIVIYPRYRLGAGDSAAAALNGFRNGIKAAFRAIGPVRLPVVAVGKSFGGSAIFYYASEASAWGVPGPRALLSVFPALPLGQLPARRPPTGVEVDLLVGDADTTAGPAGANTFARWLRAGPWRRLRYTVVRSQAGFVANHDSAQRADRPARAAFWHPADLLIERARNRTRTG